MKKDDHEDTGEGDFWKNEEWSIVVLMPKPHDYVYCHVPPRHKRGKVVEQVVGVHGVWKDDREEIKSNEDGSYSGEAKVGFLVVY
jgi:hypothetical protein